MVVYILCIIDLTPTFLSTHRKIHDPYYAPKRLLLYIFLFIHEESYKNIGNINIHNIPINNFAIHAKNMR